MHPLVRYVLARFAEASTWRAFVDFATAAGVVLSPDQVAQIISAGIAGRALIGAFLPDRKR